MNVSIHEIKTTACGQWNGLLIDAGLPADCLQPGGHPCPLCVSVHHNQSSRGLVMV